MRSYEKCDKLFIYECFIFDLGVAVTLSDILEVNQNVPQ